MRTFIVLLLLSALGACASSHKASDAAPAGNHPALSHELAWTHTHEIRFGLASEVSGYLVEFLRVPDGLELKREFPAGTVLLQDIDFLTVGMITPGREGVSFNPQGDPRSLGHGGRDQLVMAMFGSTERPRYTSIIPGMEDHGRRQGLTSSGL